MDIRCRTVEAHDRSGSNAYVLPQTEPNRSDDDPNPNLDHQCRRFSDILASQEPACRLRQHVKRCDDRTKPVIGYVSHGVHAGMPADYMNSQLQFTLGPGAVFETHESFNAYSFQPGGTRWDKASSHNGWKGGTVGVETAATSVMDQRRGQCSRSSDCKLGPSGWRASSRLSWNTTTVVGDPPTVWKPGYPR